MTPATEPRSSAGLSLLVVDGRTANARVELTRASALPLHLVAGDLVVVNDAATLPASLAARTRAGEPIEIRLAAYRGEDNGRPVFRAAILGSGDYRTRTEDRPLPPPIALGSRLLVLADGAVSALVTDVVGVSTMSPRLVDLRFFHEGPGVDAVARVWAELYRLGRPVQYAHVPAPLALWDVQNVFASRPWAFELPSAGRALRAETLAKLRAIGVEIAMLTHAAGLSATGDPAIDAHLPLPERYELPVATVRAIARARARGGRILAVGTSVVRALEAAALAPGGLCAGEGIAELLIGSETRLAVVDGILTGVHEVDTTHFSLLGAFAPPHKLAEAVAVAEQAQLFAHEFGDAWLVWAAQRASVP